MNKNLKWNIDLLLILGLMTGLVAVASPSFPTPEELEKEEHAFMVSAKSHASYIVAENIMKQKAAYICSPSNKSAHQVGPTEGRIFPPYPSEENIEFHVWAKFVCE